VYNIYSFANRLARCKLEQLAITFVLFSRAARRTIQSEFSDLRFCCTIIPISLLPLGIKSSMTKIIRPIADYGTTRNNTCTSCRIYRKFPGVSKLRDKSDHISRLIGSTCPRLQKSKRNVFCEADAAELFCNLAVDNGGRNRHNARILLQGRLLITPRGDKFQNQAQNAALNIESL